MKHTVLNSCCTTAGFRVAIPVLFVMAAFVTAYAGDETAVKGRTFYVSPDGNDANAGTMDSPFHTLNKLWTVLSAGDRVYLRGGDYKFDHMQSLSGKNGTAGKPIQIWAYPGEQPRITRSTRYVVNVGVDQDLIYFEGNYFHWKGIEISDFEQKKGDYAWPAMRVSSSSNSTFERIHYHHNGAGMSVRGNSTDNLFLNCDFHHNQDPYSKTPYGGADGIDLHFIHAGTKNTLRACRAWWNSDDGFDFWENEGVVVIEDCWSFYNGYLPDTFKKAGDGSGFKLGATSERPDDVLRTVRKCVAFKNRCFGINENSAVCKSDIFNNTCAQNGVYGYWFGSWGTNVATIRNSIGWRNPEERVSEYDVVERNSWQKGLAATEADLLSVDDSELTMPRRSDGGLPTTTFFHLKPGSRLVDAGVDVGLPFHGRAPDLGAFESGETRTPKNRD